MNELLSNLASADLDIRRRRIVFRAWHRGMREVDLLLGGFAEAEINSLNAQELDDFDALLEAVDRDVFGWFTGEIETPKGFDTGLFRKIRAFHTHTKPVHG